MNKTRLSTLSIFKIVLVIVGLLTLLSLPSPLPAEIGAIDFRPYWSSSFLLAHGQDFGDSAKMDRVERDVTSWKEPYIMYAWFAPTGNIILLPYTLFPFNQAVYYWLLTNITIISCSMILIWKNKANQWLPFVAAFSFSMTLLSLKYGQVNTLEVLGLAGALYFSNSKRKFLAGIGLALTTIKPHLVIFTLPLLLFDFARRKQWKILFAFAGTLMVCALILFIFYPGWLNSLWQLVTFGMGTSRETPTLTGLFVAANQYTWGKWIWPFGFFLAVIIGWMREKGWSQRTVIDVSIMAGLFFSPVGWSYDQIMLLIPILSVLEWATNGALIKRDAILIALALIIVNLATFYQRTLVQSEVWFFWVPFAIGIIYLFASQQKKTTQPSFTPYAPPAA